MDDKTTTSILMDSPLCFAVHKIVKGKSNKANGLEFVTVNPLFEKLFGLENKLLKGKTVNEVLSRPEVSYSEWKGLYDKIIIQNGVAVFQHCFTDSRRWYKVNAWQMDEVHVALILTDISEVEDSKQNDILKNLTHDKKTVQAEHLTKEQLCKQNRALLQLMSGGSIFQRNIQQTIAEIVEISAELVGTERVSVWLYNNDYSKITCFDLYNSKTRQHKNKGEVLHIKELPSYFACHKNGEVIDAIDVFTDPRTCEFPSSYFEECNIHSLLDTPVWFHDRLGAVLSFEHTGEQRKWTPEDISHAASMAALLSLCFQSEERRKTEQKLEVNQKETVNLNMLLNAILESPQDMVVFALDTNYCYTAYTEAHKQVMKNLWGVDIKVGDNMLDFINLEADRFKAQSNFKRCLNGEFFILEEEYGDSSFERSFYEIRYSPLFNDQSEIIGLTVFNIDITQRKQAEAQLRKLSQAVEQSPTSLIITNPQGIIEYVNPKFIQITGYKPEEVIGQTPSILKSEKHPAKMYSKLWNVISSGKEWKGEFQNKKKNGELYWESALISSIKNEHGEILHYLSVSEDVTDRKRDQEKIKFTKDTYKSVFNSVSEAIYVLDENGLFIDVNQGAELMYGYSRNELIGKGPADVSAKGMNSLEKISRIIGEVAKTGVTRSFEFWGQRKNGEAFPKDVVINRGKYFGKEHIIATARDITERKKTDTARIILYNIARSVHKANTTEEFLETIRQELGRLFDTTNFFVAIYNSEKETLKQLIFHDEMDSNHEWVEWDVDKSISGQVIKMEKTIFLQGDQLDAFYRKHQLERWGTYSSCWLGVPLVMHNKPGGVMVIQHYSNPQAYNEADVVLFEMVAHEIGVYLEKQLMIENLVKAKEKAEESDRLKSAFLANMSHEIRTPMNGILGFSELLKEPDLTGEEKEQYITLMNKSGDRMLNIINDIVDISKIEAGLTKVKFIESNINEQLLYIENFFKPEIAAKGLKFRIISDFTSEQAMIKTDREKLYAILTNLVKNAVKFTHTGKIELSCIRKDDVLEFKIEDTGIGIPRDRQHAIFERFIQADIEDRMAYQGAGLGLAITRAYIEMLGGDIWVESEEGKGSIFYFTIPLISASERKNDTALNQATKGIYKIRKLKTLIVEDDQTSQIFLKTIVNNFSREILVSNNGLEAVEVCKKNPDIDLILMDIRLPKIGGLEATRQIRQFNSNVIIVAQTAFGLAGDKEKAIEAGCNDYIAKPINKTKLMSLLKKYFE